MGLLMFVGVFVVGVFLWSIYKLGYHFGRIEGIEELRKALKDYYNMAELNARLLRENRNLEAKVSRRDKKIRELKKL